MVCSESPTVGCIAALTEQELALKRLREAAARFRVQGWVRQYPVEAVLGALAAGFIMSSSQKTIRNLTESLVPLASALLPLVSRVPPGAPPPC